MTLSVSHNQPPVHWRRDRLSVRQVRKFLKVSGRQHKKMIKQSKAAKRMAREIIAKLATPAGN